MVKTGTLEIDDSFSELVASPSDRTRLAKEEGEGDAFGNATDFLVSERNLNDEDFIFVTGEPGTHSGVKVIFITDAGLASEATDVISATTTKKSAASKKKKKKPAKKGTKKSSKKSGKKSTK